MRNLLWTGNGEKAGSRKADHLLPNGFMKLFYYVAFAAIALWAAFPGIAAADVLINGGMVAGSISVVGEVDTHTFTAEAGDRVEIQVAEIDAAGTSNPQIELYGPDSSDAILSHYATTVTEIALTIELSGTYTLMVQDGNNAADTFDYNVYYVNIPHVNELGELVNGGVRSESIDLGDLDTFTFSAEAGDSIEIQVAEINAAGTSNPQIELYGPDSGEWIVSDYATSVAEIALTIELSGTYTLLVQDGNNAVDTFDYDVYYVNIPGANEHGVLSDGDVVSETIDLGDLDTFTFTAIAGETIEIEVTEIDPAGTSNPRIELYGPNGGEWIAAHYSTTVVEIVHTIEQDGTYTILVQDGNNAVDIFDYELSFNTDATQYPCGDLDHDGDVDTDDRAILLDLYRARACETNPEFNSEADYDNDGCITRKDYRIWYSCWKAFGNE